MPELWGYNQIKVDVPFPFGSRPGGSAAIDYVVVSKRAEAVDLAAVTPPPMERELSTGTGFDVVYEWIVMAEAACERSLSDVPFMSAFSNRIHNYILSWLRKPQYWAEGTYNWLLWQRYTPENDTPEAGLARSICEQRLAGRTDVRSVATNQELAHMSATALGYMSWPAMPDSGIFPMGDLGGWALDLLQAWGFYLDPMKNPEDLDLESYMRRHVGKKGLSENAFSYHDLLADADAWLLATSLRKMGSMELALSNAMREIYQLSPAERIRKFYGEHFGSSKERVIELFGLMFDNPPTQVSPEYRYVWERLLKKASGAGRLPFKDEVPVCGKALADAMTAQSR